MTTSSSHSAARTIIASPRSIFRAFLDADAMATWRAPAGMTAEIRGFEPRVGGGYQMRLVHDDRTGVGKSAPGVDLVTIRFLEIVPNERIVEAARFQSDDAAFAGEMIFTITITPVQDGAKVALTADQVPSGIAETDHCAAMGSTLRNLAHFIE